MDLDQAAQRVGFSTAGRQWVRQLPDSDDVRLPDDPEALMEYCGVVEDDRREMLAARPDPDQDLEWWAIVSAMAGSLERDIEQPVPSTGFHGWPMVPTNASPVGMFAGAWALLSSLPRLVDVHTRRGVPETVTRATVSALGGVMGSHRHIAGRPGVGLIPLWGPPLRFRGADFEIGRHSFTRTHLGLGDGVAGHVLMIHVPPIGPLDPETSEQSITEAARMFERCYPEEPISSFVCRSWLLDPQLAEYLPESSNILRFQRRFTLLPAVASEDPHDDDRDMMRTGLSVFAPDGPVRPEDLARVPQKTTLQRAFVTHLRSGRHWQKRTGLRCVGPDVPARPEARTG
jgi:hypothetical protein